MNATVEPSALKQTSATAAGRRQLMGWGGGGATGKGQTLEAGLATFLNTRDDMARTRIADFRNTTILPHIAATEHEE